MTGDECLALLRRHNDPRYAEEPPGFDRAAAETRFSAFADELQAALDVPCAVGTGGDIQDASHHGSIRFPPHNPEAVDLRISNFGGFWCIYDRDDSVRSDVLDTIRRVAAQHGYVYIPTRVLRLPYAGRNPGVSGFRDWGRRFCDWI